MTHLVLIPVWLNSRPAEGRPRPKVTIMARALMLQKVLPHFVNKKYAVWILHIRRFFAESFAPLCQQKVCNFDFTPKKGFLQKVLPNLSTKSIQFGFYIKEGLFAKSFTPLCQQKVCSFDFTFKKGLFAESLPNWSTKSMQLRCYIQED